ncbi:MAG: hypothetical protein ACHQRK_07440 [Gemmatimonadales bacterium]|jgi:hypothetical protein
MMTTAIPRPRWRARAGVLVLLGAVACGGHNHLGEYDFAQRSMAVVIVSPPAPGLLTGGYDVSASDAAVAAVLKAGSTVAKDVEARRASARLDSATARVGVTGDLAQRTLERTSRYLGTRPVTSANDADFLLEVHMRSFGLDARSENPYLYTNAEAVLLDRRTGREIWNIKVHGTDRLTPRVRGAGQVPGAGAIIAAGMLRTMTVQDFQDALQQLADLSSNLMADELRSALRDERN